MFTTTMRLISEYDSMSLVVVVNIYRDPAEMS